MSGYIKIQILRTMLVPALGALVLTLSMGAMAQWKWVDSSGSTHYTDLPPPASIPAENILSRPDASRPVRRDPPAAVPPVAPKPVVDAETRRLDDARRKLEEEEAKKKAEQERVQRQERKKACEAAQQNLAGLLSGRRIMAVNAKGETYFLSNEQLAQRRQEAQQNVNKLCN